MQNHHHANSLSERSLHDYRGKPLNSYMPAVWRLATFLLFSGLATLGFGGVNCNSYKKVEFRSICKQFDQDEITYHESVALDGLNQIRDSWGDTQGLHIIPGNRYTLQKTLLLDFRQALLPVPSTATGGKLSAIQLSPASGFDPLQTSKSLLVLKPGSLAGGIVVEEDSPLPDVLTGAGFSFVAIPSVGSVELALSYFSGANQPAMKELINIGAGGSSAYESTPGAVRLNRVLVVAGQASASVRIQGQPAHTIKLVNSLIEAAEETINTQGALVDLTNSELYLAGGCTGNCQSITSNGSRIQSLDSIFWSEDQGYAISTYPPSGESWNTTSGWLVGNVFSSKLTVIGAEESTDLIDVDNYQLVKGSPAPFNQWQTFQQYTGKLGVTRLPSGVPEAACEGNDTKAVINSEDYQKPVLFGASGFQVRNFSSVNGFNCPGGCSELIDWGGYGLMTSIVVSVLIQVVVVVLGCYFGRKHRTPANYVLVDPSA
ncbi:MAG: hypothetical protein ACR2PT_11480 [Endozoicomonas sp.]